MGLLASIKGLFSTDKAAGDLAGESAIATSLRRDASRDTQDRSTGNILTFYNRSPALHMVSKKIGQLIAGQTWRVFVASGGSKEDRLQVTKDLRSPNSEDRWKLRREMKAHGSKVNLREIPNHPLLDLINSGNASMLGIQMRALMQVYSDLVGEVYMVIERNEFGMPTNWFPLNPAQVEKTPTAGDPFYKVATPVGTQLIPFEDVFSVRDLNPSRPFGRGIGLGRVLGDEIETHEFASKYLKLYFKNDATPSLVFMAPGLSGTTARRTEQKWLDKLRGVMNSHLPFFVNMPEGGRIHELDSTFKHGGVVELKEHERDFIIQTFGISPEIFGILTNSNRATSRESRVITADSVIIPRMEIWREAYQTCLVPQFDEKLIIDYDDPRPDDPGHKLRAASRAPWALSVDEHRQLIGEKPIGGDIGALYPVPGNIIFVSDLSEVTSQAQESPASAISED